MSSSGDVTYTVYIDFTPDADTRYGMTAVVSTLDAEIEDVEVVEEEAPAEEEDIPEGEFARDGRFAADGEGMPDELSDFGGRPMGEGAPEGSGHVKE